MTSACLCSTTTGVMCASAAPGPARANATAAPSANLHLLRSIGHDSPPGTPYQTGKSAERRHQLGHVTAGPTSPARPCLRRTCRSSGRSGPRRAAGTAECRNVVCSMFGEDALLPRAEEVDRRHGEGGQRLSHTRARAVPVAEGLRAHGRADPLAEPPEERRRRAVPSRTRAARGPRGRPRSSLRRRESTPAWAGTRSRRSPGHGPRVAPDGPSGPTSTLAPRLARSLAAPPAARPRSCRGSSRWPSPTRSRPRPRRPRAGRAAPTPDDARHLGRPRQLEVEAGRRLEVQRLVVALEAESARRSGPPRS